MIVLRYQVEGNLTPSDLNPYLPCGAAGMTLLVVGSTWMAEDCLTGAGCMLAGDPTCWLKVGCTALGMACDRFDREALPEACSCTTAYPDCRLLTRDDTGVVSSSESYDGGGSSVNTRRKAHERKYSMRPTP